MKPIYPIHNRRGFTLIEVMITVAIIGILSAVAIPSYRAYVVKGNRAAVQSHMMNWATTQSQYLADARTYATKDKLIALSPIPEAVAAKYELEVVITTTPPTFVITANPIAGGVQADDGSLTLSNTGAKTPSKKW